MLRSLSRHIAAACGIIVSFIAAKVVLRNEVRERQRLFALAQLDWLEAIKSGGQPETSGREGLLDLACSFGIVESSHAGRRRLRGPVVRARQTPVHGDVRRDGFAEEPADHRVHHPHGRIACPAHSALDLSGARYLAG